MQPQPNSPQAKREVSLIAFELRRYVEEGVVLDSMTLAERIWVAMKAPQGTAQPITNTCPVCGEAADGHDH